jgi:hypothetical protein
MTLIASGMSNPTLDGARLPPSWGESLTETNYASLECSWIDRDLADLAMLRRVDNLGGREVIAHHGDGDCAGILIPYYWPDGPHPSSYVIGYVVIIPTGPGQEWATKGRTEMPGSPDLRESTVLAPGRQSGTRHGHDGSFGNRGGGKESFGSLTIGGLSSWCAPVHNRRDVRRLELAGKERQRHGPQRRAH